MIADTAVVNTSPWSGDQMLYPKESYRMSSSPDLHTIDMDIAALEAEIEKATCQSGQADLRLNNTSCGTSVADSECSDDVCIEMESDAEHLFPVSEDQEYLTTNLWNLLGVNAGKLDLDTSMNFDDSLMADPWNMPEMTSLTEMSSSNPTTDSTDLSQYDSILSVSAPTSPQPQRKRQKHQTSAKAARNQLTAGKSWTSLSNSQQVTVIEDLTKIISNEMGLREQMEIIKIINPNASISSTDTEFVIDLDCLSNEKLEKVRALVKLHTSSCAASSVASSSSSSSGVSDCNSECSSPSQKKQLKRQQKNRPREQRQRQRKEYRQALKEKRSGLFQKEEVLALSTAVPNEEDEDADIDILL